MRIAVVGYGQMGHMVEQCARRMGHEVSATVDPAAQDASVVVPAGDSAAVAAAVSESGAEGVIEFSHPSAVMGNIRALLPLGLPLVVGTTGWTEHEPEAEALAAECGGTLVRSANFSVGVNMFYKIVEQAARLVASFPEYDTAIWEAHHARKADSPSGTALELARRVMAANPAKSELVTGAFHERPRPEQLHVSSTRVGFVPGTHAVLFDSPADTIELVHTARSREGFASGAVHALVRLSQALDSGALKRGALYGMSDLF